MRRLFSAVVLLACARPAGAAPLPDPHVAGFRFPESEATVTRWVTELGRGEPATAAVAFENLHRHAWGLWTALTSETTAGTNGRRLRVFETWVTPDELLAPNAMDEVPEARPRLPLRPLGVSPLRAAARRNAATARAENFTTTRVAGFTKFDPTAAEHIATQQLLSRPALDALVAAGAITVPPFPATALVVKPMYLVLKPAALVGGRYFRLAAWSGPPGPGGPADPAQWPGCVWIDLAGGGRGQGAIDAQPAGDGSSRTEETTYPLSDFISTTLTAADAAALNAALSGGNAAPGDRALLVGMHVAGREIARWTWQTFWWTPDADQPPVPSSAASAALRPSELRGAPRHYALALAYSMLSPDQPYTGGTNTAPAVYAYNPWLEARFTPADLPDSQAGLAPDGRPAANNHGVATNCMSCHAQATYNPRQLASAPRFTGARYVDLGDPQYVGTLQTDFLWALARHAR